MQHIKKTIKKLYIAGTVILVLLVMLAIPFVVPRIAGYEIYQVTTDSMTPNYPIGCILYVKDVAFEELKLDDVITFRTGTRGSQTVTHRIVGINEDGNYITKGDYYESNDLTPVSYEQVEGKVFFAVKFLGFLAPVFMNTYGRILLILLVAVACGFWILADFLKKNYLKNDGKTKVEKKKTSGRKGPQFRFDYVTISCFLMGIGLMLFGSSKILAINDDYERSEQLYEQVSSEYVEEVPLAPEEIEKKWYQLLNVDMGGLQELNPDIIGWLYFESGEISYPLLYSGDNTKYYRTNISLQYDTAGAIFMDAMNKTDFSDYNTFIYGHNMRNLSMFGKLKYYRLNEGYYEDHQYFQVITKDYIYRYRIFAYVEVTEQSDFFTIYREPNDDFEKFIQEVQKVSYIKNDLEVTKDDHIITMVTCNNADNERFLVHSYLVDRYERNASIEKIKDEKEK